VHHEEEYVLDLLLFVCNTLTIKSNPHNALYDNINLRGVSCVCVCVCVCLCVSDAISHLMEETSVRAENSKPL
jgi:hypothetical protein